MSSTVFHRIPLSSATLAAVYLRLLLIVSLVALLLPSRDAVASRPRHRGGSSSCLSDELRPQDELWILSTRCLPTLGRGRPAGNCELNVRKYDHEQGWQESSHDEFLEPTDLPTWIFVHGNRIEPGEVIGRCRMVYRALIAQDPDRPPVRFVAWSWPSSKIRGPIRDARSKAWRTESEAYYLGKLLSQLDSRSPVSLIGFSLGARVISGGLEVLAGGEVSSRGLPADSGPGPDHIRAVFLAAAVHSHWLHSGEYHGLALERAEHTLNLYTSCDEVLRHYRWMEKCSSPSALGYCGLSRRRGTEPPPGHYDDENVVGFIGREHSLEVYLCSPHIKALIYEGMTGFPPQEISAVETLDETLDEALVESGQVAGQ